jgi:VWFA-related protein
MTLHLYSTTDRQNALKAIKKIKGLPGMRWTLGREEQGVSREGEQPSSQTVIQDQEREQQEARLDARLEKDRVYRFTSEIGELAKALWHIPGKKNIVLFSAGIQRNLIYDQSSEPVQEQAQFGLQDIDSGLVKYVEDMSKDLAASNCPVFAVNTEGARGRLFENSLGDRGDHGLKMISDLSGGKYFPDAEDRDNIAEEIQQFTGNYYVLGYYVDETWDGKYHEIQVKVKRKGCKVYAQKGYFNPKPFSKFSGFEKKLDVLALATGGKSYFQNTLKFSSISLPFGNIEDSNFVIISKIPREKMKEIISSNTEVISLLLDEENNIILNERQETNFTKTLEDNIYHYSILPLEPGSYECRVLIRNLKTGSTAVAESAITIPEETESGMKLYPPLLLIPVESACYSKTKKKQEEKLGKKAPSLRNIYPLIPSKYFPLVGQTDRNVTNLLAVMRFFIPDIEQPALDLKAYLVQESPAQKTALASSVLYRKKESNNIHVYLIEYKLPKLGPGEYVINFIADELKTKSKSQVNSEIQVK